MVVVVGLLELGQAVVDGVGRGQAGALETDARQKGVGLDDLLDGLGAGAVVERDLGLDAVGHQGLEAELGQRQACHARLAAGTGVAVGVDGGLGLEVGGQGVAHAADRQADGARGDDRGVHQDHVRVGGQEQVAVEGVVVGVDDGQGRAGRVGAGDRRADDDGKALVVGHGLGGVEGLSAADTHDDVDALGLDDLAQAVDLGLGALAAEGLERDLGAGALEARGDLLANATPSGVGDHDEGPLAQRLDISAEVGKGVRTLDVLGRAVEDLCHGKTPPFWGRGRTSVRACGPFDSV